MSDIISLSEITQSLALCGVAMDDGSIYTNGYCRRTLFSKKSSISQIQIILTSKKVKITFNITFTDTKFININYSKYGSGCLYGLRVIDSYCVSRYSAAPFNTIHGIIRAIILENFQRANIFDIKKIVNKIICCMLQYDKGKDFPIYGEVIRTLTSIQWPEFTLVNICMHSIYRNNFSIHQLSYILQKKYGLLYNIF